MKLRSFDQSLHWVHRWLSYKFEFMADIRTWSQRMFGNKLSDLLELKFLLHIVFERTNGNWTGVRLRRLYRHTRRRKFFCSERGSLINFCCCCEKQQLKKKTTLDPFLETGDGMKGTLAKESKRQTPKKNVRLKEPGWKSSNQRHSVL